MDGVGMTPEDVIHQAMKTLRQRSRWATSDPSLWVKALDDIGYEIRRKDRIADERAGPVLTAVRNLFDLSPSWSMSDIKDGVADAGVAAEPKEVYNAVGYLTRKGLIRRTNYGQYMRAP